MATAKELGLRKGDIVNLGMHVYELVPCYSPQPPREESLGLLRNHSLYHRLPKKLSWGAEGRGLDMTRGTRVEVLQAHASGCVDVRYLKDEIEIEIKGGKTREVPGHKAGFLGSVWDGYVGFIPESLERREDTIHAIKN